MQASEIKRVTDEFEKEKGLVIISREAKQTISYLRTE
jgi:hypothetical protein